MRPRREEKSAGAGIGMADHPAGNDPERNSVERITVRGRGGCIGDPLCGVGKDRIGGVTGRSVSPAGNQIGDFLHRFPNRIRYRSIKLQIPGLYAEYRHPAAEFPG